jgi:putative transposase
MVFQSSRFGYRRLHVLLGREGEQVNHKRVHRVYREAGLALHRKKRKHCVRLSRPLGIYTAANQEWALDFLHDAVASGRSIRVLNVIDAYTRESLAMEWTRASRACALRACSTRSSLSGAYRERFAVTMARS